MLAKWRRLVHRLTARATAERELDEEVRGFAEELIARRVRGGIPPDEARRVTLAEMGGIEPIKEQVRDGRVGVSLELFAKDIAFAWRSLRRNPVFTMTVVLTLGCGIGATTAAFTQVYAVFLKDLPVRDPDALRALSYTDPRRPRAALAFSPDDYRHLRDANTTFSDLACWMAQDSQPLGERGPLRLQFVSANYLTTLGVSAVMGRVFAPDDDRVGAAPVVIVSHGAWRRDFGADPDILMRTVRIQGQPFSIVGVLPNGFFGIAPEAPHDMLVPRALMPLVRPGNGFCQVFGRLRAGVTGQQAQADLERLFRDSSATPPNQSRADARVTLSPVVPGGGPSGLRERTAPSLGVLMTISSLVLLIACANVAGLLLVRGSARTRELGTQLALGAGRGRIVGQLLTESLLLSLAGGGLGMALAYALGPLGPRFIAELGGVATLTGEPRALGIDMAPDARVLGSAVLLTALTALLCGIAPALHGSRVDLLMMTRRPASAASGRGGAGGTTFAAVQVALSMLLLVGVGLFTRTLVNLHAMPIGYRPDGMLFATLNPIDRPRAFVDEALRQIEALPGVQSVAASQWPLFNDAQPKLPVCLPDGDQTQERSLDIEWATPGFFDTWGVRVTDGADFRAGDAAQAIVNQRLVAAHLRDRPVIGQAIGIGQCPGRPVTIVGVVADHRDRPRAEVLPMVYLSYPVGGAFNPTTIALRAVGDADPLVPEVRRVIARLESSLIDGDVTTGVDYRNARIRRESLLASLLGVFGAVALLMSCVGIYGTVAYAVARHTRELGIRHALGARWTRIVQAVLGRYASAVSVGILVGALAALAASRFVDGLLFGVARSDRWSIAAAAIVIAMSAAAAAARPACRAVRVNPIEALRCD